MVRLALRQEVSALSSVSSILYHSYADFPLFFGRHGSKVNWCGASVPPCRACVGSSSRHSHDQLIKPALAITGFYVIPDLFPRSNTIRDPTTANGDRSSSIPPAASTLASPSQLLVGPYHGRPGCLTIPLRSKRVGVCAQAFLSRSTVTVQDVHSVPGHIACDGLTQSEIVLPLLAPHGVAHDHHSRANDCTGKGPAVGVLDIDCQAAGVWTEADERGLARIVELVSSPGVIDWPILLQ